MSRTFTPPSGSTATSPTDPFEDLGRRLMEVPWAEDDDDGLPSDSGAPPALPGYTVRPPCRRG